MLASISGEAGAADAPVLRHPSPSYAPEAVVVAQLAALRAGDMPGVFAFASPANKASTGPLERFAGMLHAPSYAPLLAHGAASTLQRTQASERVYMEVVAVAPPAGPGGAPSGPPALYVWVLSLQDAASNFRGCWLVDSVQALNVEPVARWAGGGAL